MLTPPPTLSLSHTHTHAQDRTLSGHLRFYPVQSGGWTEETTASASANFTMQQAAHSTFFMRSALWSARQFCFWHALHHRLLFCSWLITADVNIFKCGSMAVAWMQAGKELKADRMQTRASVGVSRSTCLRLRMCVWLQREDTCVLQHFLAVGSSEVTGRGSGEGTLE